MRDLEMGDQNFQNKDLFRWKRQTEPLVHHSDKRKADIANGEDPNLQVEHWLKRVEAATDVAARRTFSTDQPPEDLAQTSNLHRHFNNNVRFYEQKSEVAYAEAQDLLNDWMTKNFINELVGDDLAEDDLLQQDSYLSPESPPVFESGVTQAVQSNVNLLNLYDNVDSVDENDVVQDIMSNLLVAPIERNAAQLNSSKKPKPKNGWLDDLITQKAKQSLRLPTEVASEKNGSSSNKSKKLGLAKNAMAKMLEEEDDRETKVDYRKRIGDRHEQVRQNRLLRERQIEEERQKRRQARETRRLAEEMVTREEKDSASRRQAEEEVIRREMARIKKEMEDQKIQEEKERKEMMEVERRRLADEEEERGRVNRENEKAKQEEAARDRERQMRIQKLDIRIRNAQSRTLRVHFSNWRNVIIDQRLQMGQARAIADWRLLMRTWATWNGKYKKLWATQEGQRHLETMRENHRCQKGADDFYKKQLLRKCIRSWNIWVRAQLFEKELEKEKVETQKKMEAFLQACAFEDTLDIDDENDQISSKGAPNGNPKDKKPPTTPQHRKLQPWQVTKKHVYEGLDASSSSDKSESPQTDAVPKSKSAFVIDSFQHRHQAQEKMLKTQQEIIKEQQKMLEEMKFLATQNSLQQQLKEIQSGGNDQSKTPVKASRIAANFNFAPAQPKDDSNFPSNLTATKARVASSFKTVTTSSSLPQPNKFVKDMEDRARLRAERKAELDRLKEQKQKDKLEAQRRREEEERNGEEREKQKRIEEIREKKRVEKEQEMEKEKKAMEVKRKWDMALEHDRKRLLKWWGMDVWKQCLESGRRQTEMANEFRNRKTQALHLRAWSTHVRDLNAERNRKSTLCRQRQIQKRYFAAWRSLKEDSLQLEVKARQFWATTLRRKVLTVWTIWTHDEKMAGYDKEKRAQDHYDRALVKKVFQSGFKQLPVIAKKEREKESRKNMLRKKVADLLPDFSAA